MPNKPNFPTALSELDTTWLTQALQLSLPGIEVLSFEAETIGVGSGFMGDLARLQLHHNQMPAAAPNSMVVKFSSHFEATRVLAGRMNYYGRELGFYRDCADRAGVSVPRIYYQQDQAETNHFVMLMQDLAPAVPTDQVVGNRLAESEQVMLAFADLHAQWWNNPELEQLTWTAPLTHVEPIAESLRLLNGSIASAALTGRFDAYPTIQKLQPMLPPLFKMEPPPPMPYTLVHGDLRSDNIFFAEPTDGTCSKPIIIDWQTAGIGSPMTDIARWLTQSISIEQRRDHELDLLKRYHDRLLEKGVTGYSYKKMLQEYEVNLVVTLLMFSMSLDEIDQSSERAANLFHAMYSRLDAALSDWPVEKMLKVLPMLIPFMKIGAWFKTYFKRNKV
ncbi:MAG: DUF1679 domain-containing protein [Pseudomonadales bacterium]|jgi:thiamine kinase-like enzyme|tara:strand:+ start:1170 stop:2339 length:1170 start_codon:yes stop_codon:yes gene_type:complete